jgi:Ca2+-binding RTX toxin-like protein
MTASFDPVYGTLTITGNNLDNVIIVSRNAAGNLLVNGGAVPILGGVATVANTSLIVIYGLGGHDQLTLDESNGALPKAYMVGDVGNDTLTGGSGDDILIGGPGDDILLGKGGIDDLFGGDNNDTLTGGDADDRVYGEAGNDRLIWNPGDDTDLNEGGDGIDTVQVNGGNGAEVFTTTANGTRVRFDRFNPAPFFLDIGTCEDLVVNCNGGDDSFSATGNLAALIKITVDGGPGKDTLLGSNGIDLLIGGDDDDFIDGQQGNDVALMGNGNDTFQWDPGDGSDTVEGQSGTDTLLFNGSGGAEFFEVGAYGTRVLLTRNLGNILMDLDDIEVIDLNALGGIDSVTIHDLGGTDVASVNVDLAATIGGTVGDTIADTVIINGTSGDDVFTAALPNGQLVVNGLATAVSVEHFDAGLDTVRINGLEGDDVLDASAVGTDGPLLILDGGPGGDVLLGGAGADTLLGGEGDDVLFGGFGNDVLDGGVGENLIFQDGANSTSGIVTIFGNAAANTITISRDAGGNILSNGVPITGASITNTVMIRVFGLGGNDTITLNEASGALPGSRLFGGAGQDTLTGGSGGDLLFGGRDNDTLLGKGGFDFLFGGDDNDTLTGGDADDQVFGEGGDDRMIWNPGDDTDLNEGGAGTDTVEVNGGGGDEVFTTTANGARVRFDRINPAPFSIDIGTSEKLVLNANGGNDSFSATGNLAALIQITVDGGAGNDTILGSNGADLLLGGDGDDFIDGQQGNDTVFMGANNDVFQWDPGDGSDIVEGQDGTDTMLFNGSAGAEIFESSANGARVRFTRNLGNIVMDLDDVEVIDLNTLGSADTLTVNDMSGTDLIELNADLAGTIGGAAGDGAADVIIVNGTNGDDIIDIVGSGSSVSVLGLSARVNILNSEGANDSLVINALGGEDGVTATTLPAGVIKLTIDGGAGDDTLLGSQGADTFLGGAGDDFIFGDNGNDVAFMGANNDVFQWDPGDGSDTVEGQDGTDTLLFFGANIAENVDVTANGGRVIFFRNVGSVTMDLDDVETIDFRALGGADNIVAGDLSGTDVTAINLDLRGPNGGGDGAADTVTVNGTQIDDVFGAAGDAGGINVFGLHTVVNIIFQEQANDRLTLNALGGDDVVDASSLEADGIQLTMNGGLGADVFLGSEGNDLINGGDGDDTALMGAGDDTFVWNPGDDNDILEGQSGLDTMLFNGAAIAEQINIFANGGRVIFFRDVASVTMDLNDVESIDFTARGGADTTTVQDLSGTDVIQINLNLQSTPGSGAGDGAADTIIVQGTNGDDVVLVNGDATGVSVLGLAARVNITGAEAANDRLTVNALSGEDIVDASGLDASGIQFAADGGAGDDILLGGGGADTLSGASDNDVLLGGPGNDVLDGGVGENTILQDGPNAPGAIVTIFGNNVANNITISRDAAGNILSNGQVIPGATVANTALIRVFGMGDNDTITLNEANGALPAAVLYGGVGSDTITGGSGGDFIFGGSGDDTLLGKGGFDFLFGGDDNDTLTGGDADDFVFGEVGSDRMIWNPGDDTDLNEGGSGDDTVEVNGGNGAETFTTTANGTRVRFDRLDPAPFSIDIGTSENLVLNANGGNDSFSATGNLAALIKIIVDGGAGDDTILGSNGADVLLGGDNNDFIDGQQGNDTVFMGAGNDTFQWDPGDGSDIVEGQDGADTLLFNGSAGAEIFEATANGGRVLFTRNIGTILMDMNDVETINLNTLGNTDSVILNNMSGTDLTGLIIDLAGTIGGSTGDGLADTITVNGTGLADNISVTADTFLGVVFVSGLPTNVRIAHAEVAIDDLIINGLGGTDVFNVNPQATTLIGVTTNQ